MYANSEVIYIKSRLVQMICIFNALKSVIYRLVLFKALSSVDKWGGQLKTTKRSIRDFMILELKGIKNSKIKI